MKIAISQLNYHIGNFESNTSKIITSIGRAKNDNTDLIIFAELSVCGYPPRDFLEFNDFIDKCHQSVEVIKEHSNGIAIIVGSPSINKSKTGKALYNSAWFIENGFVKSIHNKALLPTYDIFDENRYFEQGTEFSVVELKGKRLAITICEDIWDNSVEKVTSKISSERMIYKNYPLDELIKQKPDCIINIAASPFSYNHSAERRTVMQINAEKYKLPLFYVNHVGAQTELIFDGGSMVVNQYGKLVDELNYFEEDYRVYDIDNLNNTNYFSPLPNKYSLVYNALVLGIKNYFEKLGFKRAVIGLSGGIDSAVVLVLACEALGAENVYAVLMPSQFSSDHSVEDAKALCQNIDCKSDYLPIESIYTSIISTLSPQFNGLPFNVAEENIQARIRGVLLMALANKFDYVLLNTSNKSETAVGYGTLYGDMCGGLAPIGDIYKTEVYELAAYINRNTEVIPANILSKEPSAELRPNQKDADSLPDYTLLDTILYNYIEMRMGQQEIENLGIDKNVIERTLRLVNMNEYKRYQTPPILRVSPKAFGMGRRMPIVAKFLN